jgi:heme/copper-type cytochrome/quinol oxidase subunit 3
MTALEAENGREAAEVVPANLAVGSRLLAAATVFSFMGPAFAYFYLRSLNSNGMWRPAGVHPPQAYGAVVMALLVASAVALMIASRTSRWRTAVACSLALGLAAVAVQCIEYTQLGFGPMSGGYASVFLGWTALTAVFALVTVLWLETLLAYGLRHSDAPMSVVGPRLSALSFYWTFLSGLAVIMWAILYLV